MTIPNLRLYLFLYLLSGVNIPATLSGFSAEPLSLPCSLPLTSSPLPQPLLPLWSSHTLLNPSASSYFDSQRSYCLFKRHTSWPALWQIAALVLRVQLFIYSDHKMPPQQEPFQTLLSLPVGHPLPPHTTVGTGGMGLEVEHLSDNDNPLSKGGFMNY